MDRSALSKTEIARLTELYHNKEFLELKEAAEASLKINDSSATLWNFLGVSERGLGNYKKAKELYITLLEKNPKNFMFLSNLGHLYFSEGNMLKAGELYERAVHYHPEEHEGHVSLGRLRTEQLKLEDALVCFKKAVRLKPRDERAAFSLGDCYRKLERFEEAVDAFEGLEIGLSRSHQLECLYLIGKNETFNDKVIAIQRDQICNPLVGAVLSHASIRFGKDIPNPFCNKPLEFIFRAPLPQSALNQDLIDSIIAYHRASKKNYKKQALLTKGTQSSGNLLLTGLPFVEPLRKILKASVGSYRNAFKHRKEGFLEFWPKDYDIYAWLVSITGQGSLAPHIHKLGWLSGSIYLQLPKSLAGDEGLISFGMHGAHYPTEGAEFDKHSLPIGEGDICMFPSSLFHNTEPFEGDEERISLAFDIMPR